MADYELEYGGLSTMGTANVNRGDRVYVKNDIGDVITVTWPTGIFDPEPNGDEQVDPNDSSTYHTVSSNAPISEETAYTVWAKPPETSNAGVEIPVAGSGNIYIVG